MKSRNAELCRLGRMALPLMTANARAEAEKLIAGMEHANGRNPASLTDFENDMQPVCKAVVSALQDGDMEAMRGLRALLPHLLSEVNDSPALADALARQMGQAIVEGLTAKVNEEVKS